MRYKCSEIMRQKRKEEKAPLLKGGHLRKGSLLAKKVKSWNYFHRKISPIFFYNLLIFFFYIFWGTVYWLFSIWN